VRPLCLVIRLKRAREPAARGDGDRVLVDRLWPRGLRKADARINEWLKDVAPSHELRRWFGHDPERFAEFRERYRRELCAEPARTALAELRRRAAGGTVTLVYAARDDQHNNAVVLAQELSRRRGRPAGHARPRSISRARTTPA
jgi:uncharacterized protein YeaO (DUF488 family)